MNPRILFLVNASQSSVEAIRASSLAQAYPPESTRILSRDASRWETLQRWSREAAAFRPDLLYLLNCTMPGAPLACCLRIVRRLPFILDTGDVIYEMARSAGTSPRWTLPLLAITENATQRLARAIVVRGSGHRDYLQSRGYAHVHVIRDGYSAAQNVAPAAISALRRKLGLTDAFVVGVLGSLVYSPRLNICYGWDLIRALARIPDPAVRGLIIGDGSGKAWLEELARREGVAGRVVFCGRIPYADVPAYLRVMDVSLSTQTNNLAGQVRTTGKLPEYMAAGSFILASRVGEAARVLPEIMLLDYEGEVDPQYPARLADRIRQVRLHPELLLARQELPMLAERLFSYQTLGVEFRNVIASVFPGPGRK